MFALLPAAQLLFWSTTTAAASPIAGGSSLVATQVGPPVVSPNLNNLNVSLTNTNSTSPGLPPTDGGGQGFSLPAILWLLFCALVGLPLVAAGVRGWKVTSGVGIGLSLAILCQFSGFPLRIEPILTFAVSCVTYSLCELRQHNGCERPR